MDKNAKFRPELVTQMAELGFLGAPFPDDFGGSGIVKEGRGSPIDLPAPASGVLTQRFAAEDDLLETGDPVAVIETDV